MLPPLPPAERAVIIPPSSRLIKSDVILTMPEFPEPSLGSMTRIKSPKTPMSKLSSIKLFTPI